VACDPLAQISVQAPGVGLCRRAAVDRPAFRVADDIFTADDRLRDASAVLYLYRTVRVLGCSRAITTGCRCRVWIRG
jgi:hypothetical protein